jgi:DNA-binding SARP family transcriptional activator
MPTSDDAGVYARILGPARVTVRGAEAPSELLWRKHLALLVYLARSPRRARTREHLVGLLWSERDEKQARHSLSEALRVFRRVLGDGGVEAEVDQVRLADGALRLDCDQLADCCAREDWIGAAQLATGEFLEGLSVPDASAFEDWLLAERTLWRGRSLEALVRGAEGWLARGDAAAAAELAHRARVTDPAAEAAARVAMRALALAGDRGGALRVMEDLTRALAAQVGASPSSETLRLAERIRESRVGRRLPTAPAAARPRPPLVGRAAELERLVSAWERARAGEGQVILVEGEPGQGKTRLIEELVARARLDDATVARFRAVPAEQERSWSGLAGLLAAGGLDEAPGLASAPAAALAALAALDSDLATRFKVAGDLAPLPPARAWSDAVRAVAAESPLLIALDDAQFLDAETADALPGLARDAAGSRALLVLGVAMGQGARFDALRERLGRDIAGDVVAVGALDTVALTTLVRWGLPRYDAAAAERLVRRLERDTAGIPLLAVSLVEAVADGFRISPEAPSWPVAKRTLADTLPGDLPPAVVGAVCARFARLPPAVQQVLGAVAALDDGADLPALTRACGLAATDVTAALDALEWDRWLVLEPPPRGYAFTAPIERRILLQEMITPGQVRRYRG